MKLYRVCRQKVCVRKRDVLKINAKKKNRKSRHVVVFHLSQAPWSLRERLRTHKVFTKDKCFYLNYHKFSIKSYVLDVY